jgi:predicted Zn finger-like uncharacterized protein
MPALKTQCPECEATLRLTVEGGGEHEVECPKCGNTFTAVVAGDASKSGKVKKGDSGTSEKAKADKGTKEKASAKKGAKAARRRDDDDDDDDDDDGETRRKKKKEGDEGGKGILLLVGGLGGLVLLLGIVVAVIASSGGDKDKNAKNNSSTDATQQQAQQPQPNPPAPNPDPNAGPKPNPNPGPTTNPNPPPKPKDNPTTGPGPNTGPNTGPNPNPPPPKPKDKEDEGLATTLPPPPKIKISGSLVPESKPVVKPPAIPPLAPDEDPFVRASNFNLEGPLPVLPKLPAANQRPLLTLEAGGHTNIIEKVFFTPKGDRVITVSEDKAVRIWDPATNETLKTIRFPAGPGKEGLLQAAAISRSGKLLAVAGHPVGALTAGKTVPIYLITPESGLHFKTLGAPNVVTALHFSNDGKWLAVGCEKGEMRLIEVATGKNLPGQVSKARVLEVKYNPNPKKRVLATLGADRFVQIWDFSGQGTPLRDLPVAGFPPYSLAWNQDGEILAMGTLRGQIKLWSAEGKEIRTLPAIMHKGGPVQINAVQFLPGGAELAVCGVAPAAGSGWAGIVNAETGAVKVAFTSHTNVVESLDVSPDGKQVVTCGGNQHETYVWSSENGTILQRFVGSGNAVWALAWSKDGKSLAWGTKNTGDENKNRPLEFTFRLDEFGIGDTPDPGKYTQRVESDDHVKLISGSNGFLVQTTGRAPRVIPAPRGEKIFSATVLPKGNAVVVACSDSVRLYDPVTLQEMRSYVGHTGYVISATASPDGRFFATGSSDQTIRIWRRDQEEPLLSIFACDRDWIAWTPQGYYTCSAQGERLIAWQLPTAAGKVPLIHPAERFRASMYQPAILKYIIPAGDLPRALAMAKKYDQALIQTVNVADVIPPEVALDGFGEGEVKLDKDTVTITATARSEKHPITSMRLLVNGRPFMGTAGVKTFAGAAPGAPVTASWEVSVPPGTHTFAVIANSPVSKGMSKVGVGNRAGEIPKPNLYVLAMGVSEYPKGVNPLNYCATDAELLAKTFQEKSKGVFNVIEVKVLTDRQATKQGILDGLDWLKSKMTPQDVGIVSFSGHGTRDMFGQFYLCPSDMNPRDRDCATCLSGKLFKERLDAMPGRLVAILDACHSGTVAETERPFAPPDALVRDLTAEDSGVIVMCASAGREYAIETKFTKAGFYTFGLVEGMSGLGDVDGDGLVYIHELDLYASARVKQLSVGRQNPTFGRPPGVRPFPIAKVEKSPEP